MRSIVYRLAKKFPLLLNFIDKDDFNIAYWEDRSKKFGKGSVVNLGHAAREYEETTGRDKERVFPYLKGLLNGNERVVLDFGCGVGRFTADLARLINGKAVGVDPIRSLLEMADKDASTEYKIIDAGKIPMPDNSVDIIWTFTVLGCISDKLLKATAAEFDRILKDGGLLFIVENTTTCPDKYFFKYRHFETLKEAFAFADLLHLGDYFDSVNNIDERFSIMAGRKRRR